MAQTPDTSRPWLETERQGPGRRYWFRTSADANAFSLAKRAAGYHISHDTDCGTTVWVSNGKTRTDAVRRIQAGVDTLAAE